MRRDFFGMPGVFFEVELGGDSRSPLLWSWDSRLDVLPPSDESFLWCLLELLGLVHESLDLPQPSDESFDWCLLEFLGLVHESPYGDSAVRELSAEWRFDDFGNSGRSLAGEFIIFRLDKSAKVGPS